MMNNAVNLVSLDFSMILYTKLLQFLYYAMKKSLLTKRAKTVIHTMMNTLESDIYWGEEKEIFLNFLNDLLSAKNGKALLN